MISVGKLVKAKQTLADLVHEFESLAEKYHRAEESLNAGQSLDVHRRDVDLYSISAGMCLLGAVARGFIRSADSAVWNLFDARTNRIDNHIRVYSGLQAQWKELADPSSSMNEPLGYGNYISPSEAASYYLAPEPSAPLEPIDLDALRRKAESHLQDVTQLKTKLELESDLDVTSDEGRSLLMWTWEAFVRLELVPNHVGEFKADWQERLVPPDFFAIHGVKDSGQRNQPRSLFEKVPGETKEDRQRYCVASRANIYATACRVIAKLLHAEIARRLSEIGRLQTSGEADGGVSSMLAQKTEAKPKKRKAVEHRRTNEELFKAALQKHHGYENGSVSNFVPITTRQIEELSSGGISDTTAGRLLAKHFVSVDGYRSDCLSGALTTKLVVLLGDGLHAYGTFDPTENDTEDDNDADDE